MKSETQIKRACKGLIKKYKVKFVPYCPYPYGEPGNPDWVGCIDGRLVWIEFKKPGKEPEPLQMIRAREWRAVGATVWVVSRREELKKLLEEHNVERITER